MNSRKNRQKDNHLYRWQIEEYIRHIKALEAQVQSLKSQVLLMAVTIRLMSMTIRRFSKRIKALENSEQRLTIQLEEYIHHVKALEARTQWQQEDADEQIKKANERTATAQKLAWDSAVGRSMEHEPSRQPSTYIVPKCPSSQLDQFLSFFVPRFIFMVNLAVVLAAAFVLAIPSLLSVISPFFDILIRRCFLTIAVTTVVLLVLEISRHRKP
jgi:ABC-type multidrug transport system fused ATPase/permease subunit